MLRVAVVGVWCLALFVPSQAILAAESCEMNVLEPAKAIRAKIKALRATMPKDLVGRQVDSGACTVRAMRLGLIVGTTKTWPNVRDIEEALACLELDLFYLKQSCVCVRLGKEQSRELDVEGGMVQSYRNIREAEKRVRRAGIKNPAIRELVRHAQKARDCFSRRSLEELRLIEARVSDLESGQ